ncbi:hypothetical protein GTQ40_04135 [Flavobacteriaceae bacterium R38]|nr:hypothetical protein [Flavobacteriaceae bacterium R38]
MVKFIRNSIFFLIIALIVGEIVVRITHVTSDLPRRTIDSYGIQKYFPNQTGYWKGGNHKWRVNELGWPGVLPDSYDNLITVIGDSYIENFMNPDECHQSFFLKEKWKNYNFLEAGRSGVSFIEAMEISKQLDSLNPKFNLIYVEESDFLESIVEISPASDITQLSLEKNKIIYGKMKSPVLKKILYNWKLLYYFYNRFPLSNPLKTIKEEGEVKDKVIKQGFKFNDEVDKLINYVQSNYNIDDKVLIFKPNSNKIILKKFEEAGFKTILLNSENDKTWTFDYDSHWTCYGHKRAAEQLTKEIINKKYINP